MIVVIGEALVDRVRSADGSVERRAGGGPANVARRIGRLGIPVAFVGRLSRDADGTFLRAALEADGVDLRWAPATDDRSTTADARLDPAGEAHYAFDLAGTSAAGLTTDEITTALADVPSPVAAVHVGSLGLVGEPVGTSIESAMRSIPASALRMLDPNVRPAAIGDARLHAARLLRIAAAVDLVQLSRVDAVSLAAASGTVGDGPRGAVEAVAHRFLEAGARAVVVTDGPRPITILTRAGRAEVAVPRVAATATAMPRDSIGMGDRFGGTVLAEWTRRGLGRDAAADPEAVRAVVAAAVGRAG